MQLSSTLPIATAGFLVFALAYVLRSSRDPREPSYVTGRIPYLSHSIGLFKEKTSYYVKISKQAKLPIFTLPLIGTKFYVVCSPRLVMSIQKMSQQLAFEPVAVKLTAAISGCSKEAEELLMADLTDQKTGFIDKLFEAIRKTLLPGSDLDEAVRPMIGRIASSINQLAETSPAQINLADWLRHEIVMATAEAVWGPINPLQDKKVEDAFWEFEDGLYGIIFGVVPSLTARGPFAARQVCIDAFERYFLNRHHEQGSALIKARYTIAREHGLSVRDIAKFEVLNIVAAVVNTYPAVFWMIYYVFSQHKVLEELRAEVAEVVTSEPLSHGHQRHTIDIAAVKASCPVLVSTLQETLRHRSTGGSFRLVKEDTLLDNRYLLKKDAMIIMPSGVYHSDSASWGSNVDEFQQERFVKMSGTKAQAFRGFGGGHTLCPGRHFASTEMLATVAILLARFDFQPVGDGVWPPIKTDRVKLWAQITDTEPSLNVNVQTRACWTNGDEWMVKVDKAGSVIRMTAEDRD